MGTAATEGEGKKTVNGPDLGEEVVVASVCVDVMIAINLVVIGVVIGPGRRVAVSTIHLTERVPSWSVPEKGGEP